MARISALMLTVASLLVVIGLFALRFKTKSPAPGDPFPSVKFPAPLELMASARSANSGTQPTNPDEADPAPPSLTEMRSLAALASPRAVVLPLAFQEYNRELWNLSDQQVATINELRKSFLEKVGGTNQNPNDPAYLEAWQKAQPELDALLWFKLGRDFFQEAQLQAYASGAFAARAE